MTQEKGISVLIKSILVQIALTQRLTLPDQLACGNFFPLVCLMPRNGHPYLKMMPFSVSALENLSVWALWTSVSPEP